MERVAVVFERGRTGAAALARAAGIARESACELTVLTLAPQDTRTRCCGVSSSALNDAVFEAARAELRDAEELLAGEPVNARFRTLVEGADPPISDWATREGMARVLLPARAMRARHPLERSLRAVMGDRVVRVGP